MKYSLIWLWSVGVIAIVVALGGALYHLYTVWGGGVSGLVAIGLVACGTLILEHVKRKREKHAPKRPTAFDGLAEDQKERYRAWLNRLLPFSVLLVASALCVAIFLPSQRVLGFILFFGGLRASLGIGVVFAPPEQEWPQRRL